MLGWWRGAQRGGAEWERSEGSRRSVTEVVEEDGGGEVRRAVGVVIMD